MKTYVSEISIAQLKTTKIETSEPKWIQKVKQPVMNGTIIYPVNTKPVDSP